MDLIESKDTEDIGWHLIARGGDMTARVHPSMHLGVLPSGDLSFETPDAVLALDLAGQALTISVVSDDYELETDAGERTRTIRVSPQTHICLDFLGHTLDIDNDFAAASRPGNALSLFTLRKGEKRQLGPVSAPAHGTEADIIVPAQRTGGNLARLPVDHLQREHDAAAADKRKEKGSGAGFWRAAGVLVVSVAVIAILATVAIQVAEDAPTDSAEQPTGAQPVPAAEPAGSVEAAVPGSTSAVAAPETPGLGADVLDRFAALLAVDPLPDKATLDFVIESLRSLMLAFPDDPRVPEALTRLNERLVDEARSRYDDGDALGAGRLIEQASGLGMAQAYVQETLEYFERQPPGRTAPAAVEQTADAGAEPEAGAVLDEALERELESIDPVAVTEPDGLDSMVESATGLAIGALAVETPLVEEPATESLGGELQPAVGSGVSVNELPAGLSQDGATGIAPSAATPIAEAAQPGLEFRPYSALEVRRHVPLEYPRRAVEGSEGTLEVEFTVSDTGQVMDVTVRGEAPAIFLRTAEETIRQWEFEPVRQDGEVVPVRTALRITYEG